MSNAEKITELVRAINQMNDAADDLLVSIAGVTGVEKQRRALIMAQVKAAAVATKAVA